MIKHSLPFIRGRLAAAILLALAGSAVGQNTQPVWYPPLSLYGRPVAQPFFDFPVWARYCNCRPAPLAWGYDPYPDYGPVNCDNCQGVGTVNCPGDFVCHRPSIWYASADLAPLQRAFNDTPLVRRFVPATPGINLNPGVGAGQDMDFVDPGEVAPTAPFFTDPIFGTNDLEPAFDAGGKFTVGAHVLGCLRVEGTYMGSYYWNTAAAVHSTTPTLATVFSGFLIPPGAFAGATDVSIFSQTKLNSAEANVRYWVDMPPGPFDVSILVGGRFLQIDDSFRYLVQDTTGATPTNDVSAAAENTLWGVQIGIAGDWMVHPRFWINTDLKVGIYDNRSSLNYLATGPVAPLGPINATGRSTAFVGDIAIEGHWQMTPWLVFNLGYQFLIVDGLATGQDNVIQPPFLPQPFPPGVRDRYDMTGQITFHGPTIGLMAIW